MRCFQAGLARGIHGVSNFQLSILFPILVELGPNKKHIQFSTHKLSLLTFFFTIAKYFLYIARNQSETPNIKVFLALLESKVRCERQMAIKNSSYKKYEAKWNILFLSEAVAFVPLLK